MSSNYGMFGVMACQPRCIFARLFSFKVRLINLQAKAYKILSLRFSLRGTPSGITSAYWQKILNFNREPGTQDTSDDIRKQYISLHIRKTEMLPRQYSFKDLRSGI